MWIERIDFAGFGKLTGEKVEFKPNKLNLIVEPNDYGKSTIAEAIWAIIFDFPRNQKPGHMRMTQREARRPKRTTQLPYIASIDVVAHGRSLKVIRDFDDGSVQVVDRARGNADVTTDFLGRAGDDEIGLRLTGISRELFLSTFFIGQRGLDEHSFGHDADLASVFQSIADSSTTGANAGAAIALLDDSLNKFSYRGAKNRLDTVIRDLELRQSELKVRVHTLRDQHRALAAEYAALIEIDQKIDGESQQFRAQEYFDLCMRAAELDNRMIKAQGHAGKLQDMRNEVKGQSDLEDFPADTHKQMEELWMRRASRHEDYERLATEIAPKMKEYEEQESQIRERWSGLEQYTAEDAQVVGVLAIAMQNTQIEITELRQKREMEALRVKDQQAVDVDKVEEMRKSLHALETKEVDDARMYEALINAALTQIGECEKAVERAKAQLQEIEEEKKGKKGVFFNEKAFKRKEIDTAELDVQQQSKLAQDLGSKIKNLEVRLDNLARKAGLADGGQLLKHVQEYNTKSVVVRELDIIDQNLSSREMTLHKTKLDLKPFFDKASRPSLEITSDGALALATDAARYIEETRKLSTNFASVKQAQQQLDFLLTEITDIEALLESVFIGAGLTNPPDLEASYSEFQEKLERFKRLESTKMDLARLENEISYEVPEEDLQIERLEAQRNEALTRMQDLVKRHPEIAEMGPPPVGTPTSMPASDSLNDELEALRQDREQRIIKVRSVINVYDETYLESEQELARVENDLEQLKQARTAIDLARGTLERLSGETYVDWASKLNGISKELVEHVGLDYENLQFESDLTLSVQRKGQAERLRPAQIMSQLSTGTKEQLHWLARMVICRFLSSEESLPIVLDEIFSETDDERFLRMMQFLLSMVTKNNQIIMFSCHYQRYRWLLDRLTPAQRELVEVCKKSSLRPDTVRT
jgi:chromosome segregation ATPase